MRNEIKINGEKAQAMVELAVFGGIILVVFGILLSFIQQFNNQQYVAMEAFRRALEKSCVYQGSSSGGAGSSVQYTMMQTRRQVDMSGPFHKGTPTTINASANVFWAVPEVKQDAEPESLIVMRINEDEKEAKYRDFIPKPPAGEKDKESFRTEEVQTAYKNIFNDTASKQESSGSIINTKTSDMEETLTTIVPYVITKREEPDDYDDSNDVIVKQGTFWEVKQGVYLDTDGQYKYKSDQLENKVVRSRTWETEF